MPSSTHRSTSTSQNATESLSNSVLHPQNYKLKHLCARAISKNLQTAKHKVFLLLAMHLQNFQTAIITNRRRSQQRVRRRQQQLRLFFFHQLRALQMSFIETLPMLCHLAVKYGHPYEAANDENENKNPKSIYTNIWPPKEFTNLNFHEYAYQHFDDEHWLTTFRVSKKTFQWLCNQLHGYLKANVGKRVALALYTLSNGDNYRNIESLFGIPRSIVLKLLKRFTDALLAKLGKCLITMPKQTSDYEEIRNGFRQISNMPALVVGVLGVSEFTQQSGNCEGKIVLHTVIDDRLLFRKLQIQNKAKSGIIQVPNEINKLERKKINERRLPSFLVTSVNAHPLRCWLMKRYEEPVVPHEYDFNEAIDNLLIIKEAAFRRLYARWQILNFQQRRKPIPTQLFELIIISCCALHNLLEELEEDYQQNWEEHVLLNNFEVSGVNEQKHSNTTNDDKLALEMREFLAKTISSTEM